MRYFLRRRVPPLDPILLVESGSRHVTERFLDRFLRMEPEAGRIDLLTCFPGRPGALSAESGVWNVTDHPGAAGRKRLLREIRSRRHRILVILCTGEPLMTKWKWLLVALLPAKVLIVNENADFFWCDWSNWRTIERFVLYRAGLSGAGAVRTAAGVVSFPFVFAYLVAFTLCVHVRVRLRSLFGLHVTLPGRNC